MKLVYFLPILIVFVLTPAFAYNSGFRPVYQPPGAGSSPPTELYCDIGKWFNAYNSTTNSFNCETVPAGNVYQNNTASSSGVGHSLVLPKIGVDLPFRGIFCAGDLLCSTNTTDLRIEYTPTISSIALNDLTDVIISGATYPSVLFYNGVDWVNRIFSINNQTVQNDFQIVGINNQTGVITRNQFSVNTITCSGSDVVSSIDNVTGYVTCVTLAGGSGFTTISSSPQTTATILSDNSTITNKAVIKTLTQSTGITLTNGSNAVTIATNFKVGSSLNTTNGNNDSFLTGFDNSTGDFTRKIFAASTTTCSGTDKVSSYNNQTGVVTCSADQTGAGGSGIPSPPKKWGELIPKSASADTLGLVSGCTILGTATFVYDTTDNSNAILSTTAVTDGINGGIHCSTANHNLFRGDQNAYMYSKVEWNKITTNRVYVGFVNSATHLPNNAETILDNLSGVGLCVRTTDTLLQWCRNDGDATTDYVSTGVTEAAGTVYRIIISTVDSGVTWCGSINESQTCWTTEIPAATTRMYADSTGETDGGGSAILWTQYIWYLQSDK